MNRNEYRFTELVQTLPDLDSELLWHVARDVAQSQEILPDQVCVTLSVPKASTFAQGAEELFGYLQHNWPELVESWR
jgi:hypothetical protein